MFAEASKGYYQVNPETYDDGVQVCVTMTYDEMRDLLAAYDPASGTSPAVTLVRPLVRAMLDAVIADGGVPAIPPV
jgi:hypothetical protein